MINDTVCCSQYSRWCFIMEHNDDTSSQWHLRILNIFTSTKTSEVESWHLQTWSAIQQQKFIMTTFKKSIGSNWCNMQQSTNTIPHIRPIASSVYWCFSLPPKSMLYLHHHPNTHSVADFTYIPFIQSHVNDKWMFDVIPACFLFKFMWYQVRIVHDSSNNWECNN